MIPCGTQAHTARRQGSQGSGLRHRARMLPELPIAPEVAQLPATYGAFRPMAVRECGRDEKWPAGRRLSQSGHPARTSHYVAALPDAPAPVRGHTHLLSAERRPSTCHPISDLTLRQGTGSCTVSPLQQPGMAPHVLRLVPSLSESLAPAQRSLWQR